MNVGNAEFLKGRFREYYLKNDVLLPPRFNRREYGFMFFDRNYVLRHISFKSKYEIKKFLVNNVPKSAYHSTAYYLYPNKKDMDKKGWMGADLIFDLDADHIPETEGMPYHEMLRVVKREAEKLIVDFLLDDFGFDEGDLTIAFSGGRGYHIHIRREDIFPLKSDERREIVSYITGEGYNITKFLKVELEKRRKKRRKKYVLPDPKAGGWYGKVRRGINDASRNLWDIYVSGGRDALVEEISSVIKNKKSTKIVVKELLSEIKDYTNKLEFLARDDRSEKLQIFETDDVRDLFLKYVKEKIRIRGEADEPVTTDIHRLIRLIGSLHGKTGLAVKKLSFSEFKEFNPLKDGIPEIFKDNESKIFTNKKVEVYMNNKKFVIDGEDCVPDFVAIFIIARGMGDFVARC